MATSAGIGKPTAEESDECEMPSSSGLLLLGVLERGADGQSLGFKAGRLGAAETYCEAGVGDDLPNLLKVEQSRRPIIALDGCQLAYAKSCLTRHDIEVDLHHALSVYGERKRCHADVDPRQAGPLRARILPAIMTLCGNSALPAPFAGSEPGADEMRRHRS